MRKRVKLEGLDGMLKKHNASSVEKRSQKA